MTIYVRPRLGEAAPPAPRRELPTIEPGHVLAPPGPIRVSFRHGLGDCVNFALALQLYRERGYECHVRCGPEKLIVFQAAGVQVEVGDADGEYPPVPWHDGIRPHPEGVEQVWAYNKIARNLGAAPLPEIGPRPALWRELCQVSLPGQGVLPDEDVRWAEQVLRELPRPVMLMHTKGRTYSRWKSLPDDVTLDTCRHYLERTGGSVVFLNRDGNMPQMANWQVRNLEGGQCLTMPRMLALIRGADLLAGVDSGPLHLARLSDTPAVGLFPTAEHFPATYCLPRANQVNLTPGKGRPANAAVRIAYNIIECKGPQLSGAAIAQTCLDMLTQPRYLPASSVAADIQLRQFTMDWLRGGRSKISSYVDRQNSMDLLFREIASRFEAPTVLETGCIREAEDWQGAGYSTYLIGAFLQRHGGKLFSVDFNRDKVKSARKLTYELPCIKFACQESVAYIENFKDPIDVLYLDSAQASSPDAASHTLNEVQAAMPNLHSASMIVFDDTVWDNGTYTGRGEKAVPWLLEQEWHIVYSGYQTICSPSPGTLIQ